MKKIYSILLSLIIILGTAPQINAINIETNDNIHMRHFVLLSICKPSGRHIMLVMK